MVRVFACLYFAEILKVLQLGASTSMMYLDVVGRDVTGIKPWNTFKFR